MVFSDALRQFKEEKYLHMMHPAGAELGYLNVCPQQGGDEADFFQCFPW